DAGPRQRAGERLPARRGAGPEAAERGVVLDEVHVEVAVSEERREAPGVGRAIVDAVEEQVLDEHAPPGRVRVATAGGPEVGGRLTGGRRHGRSPGPVVGGA